MKIEIDRERLAAELDALGEISQEPPPVVTRVVFTEADVRGREFVKSLCREAGLAVREDAVGNTFARWVGESPELDVDFEARLWGSYLGEVLRRRYAGSWEMTQYPGGMVAVPSIDVRGSRLFPLMKVYRRLTVGEEEDLRAFFAMVTERLGKPAQVN